jgi:hypothetical protein
MDIEKVKDKLKKLMALSSNGSAADGEIQNAIDAATRLMAQHNLTRDDIDWNDEPEKRTQRVQMGRHTCLSNGVNLTTWEAYLGHFVKEFTGFCSYYREGAQILKKDGIILRDKNGEPRKASKITFYGSDESARAAVELFEELRDVIASMAIARFNSWARGDGAAYSEGFAMGLISQLDKSRQRLEAGDEQTRGLVLRDKQNQVAVVNRAKNWLHKEHNIKLSTSSRRSGSNGSAEARSMGRRDGSNYSTSSRKRQRIA